LVGGITTGFGVGGEAQEKRKNPVNNKRSCIIGKYRE
jgi:hypothetical protein